MLCPFVHGPFLTDTLVAMMLNLLVLSIFVNALEEDVRTVLEAPDVVADDAWDSDQGGTLVVPVENRPARLPEPRAAADPIPVDVTAPVEDGIIDEDSDGDDVYPEILMPSADSTDDTEQDDVDAPEPEANLIDDSEETETTFGFHESLVALLNVLKDQAIDRILLFFAGTNPAARCFAVVGSSTPKFALLELIDHVLIRLCA